MSKLINLVSKTASTVAAIGLVATSFVSLQSNALATQRQEQIYAQVYMPQVIERDRTEGDSAEDHAWTLNDDRAKYEGQLTNAEENKYERFKEQIQVHNLNPKEAAKEIGDSNFKNLRGDLYQIRLSQRNRVLFTIDWDNHKVFVRQVGGHT